MSFTVYWYEVFSEMKICTEIVCKVLALGTYRLYQIFETPKKLFRDGARK